MWNRINLLTEIFKLHKRERCFLARIQKFVSSVDTWLDIAHPKRNIFFGAFFSIFCNISTFSWLQYNAIGKQLRSAYFIMATLLCLPLDFLVLLGKFSIKIAKI